MQCIYNVKKKGDEEEEVEESGEGEVVENREVAGELLCANLELKALPAGSSTSSTCPRTAVCTPSTTDSESESEPGTSQLESSSHGVNPNNVGSKRVEKSAGGSSSASIIGAAAVGSTLPDQSQTRVANMTHGGGDFACLRNPPSEPRPCLNITSLSVSTFEYSLSAFFLENISRIENAVPVAGNI